jgi:hypothetical protein
MTSFLSLLLFSLLLILSAAPVLHALKSDEDAAFVTVKAVAVEIMDR